jgi:hypothetical protein
MTRPPFWLYLIAAFGMAALSVWLPFYIGGIHGYQSPAFYLTLAWFTLFAGGLALYGRRGLWLLLASPPAFFWMFLLGGAVICARGCG